MTYGVATTERLNVEKGEGFLGFEELEAGDFAWEGESLVVCSFFPDAGGGGWLTFDDLAEDAR